MAAKTNDDKAFLEEVVAELDVIATYQTGPRSARVTTLADRVRAYAGGTKAGELITPKPEGDTAPSA